MIIEYNAPNKVLFNRFDLGSYRLMAFHFKEILEGSPIEGVQDFPLADKAL